MTAARAELGELVDYVAVQLLDAEKRALNRTKPIMKFDQCELELAVQLEVDAKAGIKVYVVDLGAGGKLTDSNKITVKFSAIGLEVFEAETEPSAGRGNRDKPDISPGGQGKDD